MADRYTSKYVYDVYYLGLKYREWVPNYILPDNMYI